MRLPRIDRSKIEDYEDLSDALFQYYCAKYPDDLVPSIIQCVLARVAFNDLLTLLLADIRFDIVSTFNLHENDLSLPSSEKTKQRRVYRLIGLHRSSGLFFEAHGAESDSYRSPLTMAIAKLTGDPRRRRSARVPTRNSVTSVSILFNCKTHQDKLDALIADLETLGQQVAKPKEKIVRPVSNIKTIMLDRRGSIKLTAFKITRHKGFTWDAYSDEFKPKTDLLEQAIRDPNASGIALLYGPPGTGKTTYLAYLINALQESRQFIYIPPSEAGSLDSPMFLSLIRRSKKRNVLIIEDADEYLVQWNERARSSKQSSLLNLSSGLLGDDFSPIIICTLNVGSRKALEEDIDPALLRAGRLIMEHCTAKIPVERVAQVYETLSGKFADDLPEADRHEMTIAEIAQLATGNQKPGLPSRSKKRRDVGFAG